MSADRLAPDPFEPAGFPPDPESDVGSPPLAGPSLTPRTPRTGSALRKPAAVESTFTPEQRLLILDAWRRSGLAELLADRGVAPLYSPPRWPRYNGSIEAGIGTLKERTDAWAARAGHAGEWTGDDVAGACVEANALPRPRGGGVAVRMISGRSDGRSRQTSERHSRSRWRQARASGSRQSLV